jgi:hypothetical protein
VSSAVYDTLILSDLHLGSEVSRAEEALRMLRANRFHRLILLGDIFSDLNFGRLTKPHWKFLSYIRKLSNPKRGVQVVWVEGNHDHGLSNVMSHLVGVKVYQEYQWDLAAIGTWQFTDISSTASSSTIFCSAAWARSYIFSCKKSISRARVFRAFSIA